MGDKDGVTVFPAHPADRIAEECTGLELLKDFVPEEVTGGAAVIGPCPCTEKENRKEYQNRRARAGG